MTGFDGCCELGGIRGPERELPAQAMDPGREPHPAVEPGLPPGGRGLLLRRELAGIEQEVDTADEVRQPLMVDRRPPRGVEVARQGPCGVRGLRQPQADWPAVAAEEGRVEVDPHL